MFLKSHPIQSLFHILLIWAALFAIINKIPKRLNQITGPGWTSTHQWTNVDGWCTDGCTFFVPPCLWANQDGERRLTLFFPPSSRVFFWGNFSFRHPSHSPKSHRPTCIYITHLCTLASSLPHLPTLHAATYLPAHPTTYLSTHLTTFLCTYTLNFHQGNHNTGW
jgi:hypothetical protein